MNHPSGISPPWDPAPAVCLCGHVLEDDEEGGSCSQCGMVICGGCVQENACAVCSQRYCEGCVDRRRPPGHRNFCLPCDRKWYAAQADTLGRFAKAMTTRVMKRVDQALPGVFRRAG